MAASDALSRMIEEAMVPMAVPAGDTLVVLPVAVSLLFGAVLLALRGRPGWHPAIAVCGLALVFGIDFLLLAKVMAQGPVTMMMGAWKPPFGIAFTVDLLGALFLCAAGLVALACGLHAVVSVPETERRYGFFPFLFLMMAGVSGAFLTGDVFNLYVWFEVLLIGSFGLLVLGSRHGQLDGATKYCFLNLVATTLFLVATGLLYGVFGTLNMADVAVKAPGLQRNGAVLTIAVLYLAAFGMKAAAFPLNAWLPASYHTPRFVVSALFAGLLTKVGIYALIRVLVMLFPPERAMLGPLIAWIAGLTMLVGALGALAQADLRRLLNYLVVAGIGTILAGLALPPLLPPSVKLASMGAVEALSAIAPTVPPAAAMALQTGLSGAIFYALHSILVMTALYLAAHLAARRCGSASLHEMGGLWRRYPGFSCVVLVLLAAVCGLPPFSGFWPKLGLVRATLAGGLPWLGAAILVSGFLTTIASARVFALAFWRPAFEGAIRLPGMAPSAEGTSAEGTSERRAEGRDAAGAFAMLPLLALLAFIVGFGLFPEPIAAMTDAAAAGILDPQAYVASVFGEAR